MTNNINTSKNIEEKFNVLFEQKKKKIDKTQHVFAPAYQVLYQDLLKQKYLKTSRVKSIRENILSDCEHIYQALMPLYKLGIHFDLALVGGAGRDLMLGKPELIKDLDILLSFSPNDISPTPEEILQKIGIDVKNTEDFKLWKEKIALIKYEATAKEFKAYVKKICSSMDTDTSSYYYQSIKYKKFIDKIKIMNHNIAKSNEKNIHLNFYMLIEYLIKQSFNIDKSYPPREIKQVDNNFIDDLKIQDIPLDDAPEDLTIDNNVDNDLENSSPYLNERLKGVIKLGANHVDSCDINNNTHYRLHYPSDILITYGFIDDYVKAFDFSICENSFTLVNKSYTQKRICDFPLTIDEFIKKFTPTSNFFQTYSNKVITIDINLVWRRDVYISLYNHLPRILQKHPDYQVHALYDNDKYHDTIYEIKEKLDVIIQYNNEHPETPILFDDPANIVLIKDRY